MPERELMPTGIASLDSQVGGGFPPGALVLLLGDTGAGDREFAMSTAIMSAAMRQGRIKPSFEGAKLPEECWWVTFTRSPDDIREEISSSFNEELAELFNENVNFKDFSEEYFRLSAVPAEWVSEESIKKAKKEKLESLGDAFAGLHRRAGAPSEKPRTVLDYLSDFLTEKAPNNLVILYTLSDLARLYSDTEEKWYDFTLFLRGLQRAAKKWNGLILTDMDAGLFEPRREEEIAACADGVMRFEWETSGAVGRRRVMYFQKFRGLLPRVDGASNVKFQTTISESGGFEVARAELIEGLK